MKHVVVIGPRAFPSSFEGTSGVEVYVEELLRSLTQRDQNLKITLFVRRRYQQLLSRFKHPSIKIVALWSLPGRVLEPVSYCCIASLLACFQRANVVWYHTAGMSIFAWLPWVFRKEIWVTVHSQDWLRKKWNTPERHFFYHAFVLSAKCCINHLFAVSDILAQEIRQITGRQVTLTLPGLPSSPELKTLQAQQKNTSQEYILYLGRLVPEKRVEWLLQYAQEEKVKVIIAGSHGNYPTYEKQLRQRYQTTDITWYGSIQGKKKWQLLQQAKMVVLPSELEGFPIVVLEALRAEVPVFLHQDILPAKLNTLSLIWTFSGKEYRDFAQSLRTALRKIADLRPSLSRGDRQILSGYDWGSTASVYLRFL